jgi:hypothetical protein
MQRAVVFLALLALVSAPAAYGAEWYWIYDGTTDIRCAPFPGSKACVFQYNSPSPGNYWEIVDNGMGGKALKAVKIPGAATSFRWTTYAIGEEAVMKPPADCAAPAMLDASPEMTGWTVVFRIKVEEFTDTSPGGLRRFFTGGFNTAIPNGSGGFYRIRPELCLRQDAEGNVWLAHYRQGTNICKLKEAGQPGEWHTIWMKITPNIGSDINCTYRIWMDGVEQDPMVQDRGVAGAHFHLRLLQDLGSGASFTILLDHFLLAYGGHDPGSIPIPADKVPNTNNIGTLKRNGPEGAPCQLNNKYVTGVFADPEGNKFFYIEQDRQQTGIKVQLANYKSAVDWNGNPVEVKAGDRVNVSGGLFTPTCEQQVAGHAVTVLNPATYPPTRANEPLGLNQKNLTKPLLLPSNPGPAGLSAQGLLVRAWGKMQTDLAPGYFYIDDGSGYSDGLNLTDFLGARMKGIRAMLTTGIDPPQAFVDDYVSVVGVLGNYRLVNTQLGIDKTIPVIWTNSWESESGAPMAVQ